MPNIESYLEQFSSMDEIPEIRPDLAGRSRPPLDIGGVDYKWSTNHDNEPTAETYARERQDYDSVNSLRMFKVLAQAGIVAFSEDEAGALTMEGRPNSKAVVTYKHPEARAWGYNSLQSKMSELLGGKDYSGDNYHYFIPPTDKEITEEQFRLVLHKALLDPEFEKEAEIARTHMERVKKAAQ